MKGEHLLQLEQTAFALKRAGKLKEAAETLAQLVKERPDWEHGTGFYNLASCQEELGEFDSAGKSYLEALRYWPNNPYFLGGYAVFQVTRRNLRPAFETYLKLLEAEHSSKSQRGVETAVAALKSLGKRIGMPDQLVVEKIGQVVPSISMCFGDRVTSPQTKQQSE